ncbi:hypothetical protein AB1N83_013295 [Pleurotus pulmonarius]
MLRIPLDIERLCVEVVISHYVLDSTSSSPKELPSVLWVCRRFKAWCYPHLYRSIIFNPDDLSIGLPLLRRTLVGSPQLALLVQELTLPHRFIIGDAMEILPLCVNLISLLVWDDQALDLTNNKALRRLSCFPTVFHTTLGSSLPPNFIQLTHLDLITADARSTWYTLFASLINLTHLFTEHPSLDSELLCLIEHLPPSLCVCILFEDWPCVDDRTKRIASGEVDRRIVFSSTEHVDLSTPYIIRQADEIWAPHEVCAAGTAKK